MFEDTGLLIIWLGLTWSISHIAMGFIDAWSEVKQEVEKDVRKKLNDIVHLVKPEEHGDMEYWFDKDSDEFLAQGVTFEEIRDTLKSRYPNHLFFFKDSEQRIIMLTAKNNWEPLQVDSDIKIKL